MKNHQETYTSILKGHFGAPVDIVSIIDTLGHRFHPLPLQQATAFLETQNNTFILKKSRRNNTWDILMPEFNAGEKEFRSVACQALAKIIVMNLKDEYKKDFLSIVLNNKTYVDLTTTFVSWCLMMPPPLFKKEIRKSLKKSKLDKSGEVNFGELSDIFMVPIHDVRNFYFSIVNKIWF